MLRNEWRALEAACYSPSHAEILRWNEGAARNPTGKDLQLTSTGLTLTPNSRTMARLRRNLHAAALALFAGSSWAADYRILDPLAVRPDGDPAAAVVTATAPAHPERARCDLVVIGGGMGGVAAAIAGAKAGIRVCITD